MRAGSSSEGRQSEGSNENWLRAYLSTSNGTPSQVFSSPPDRYQSLHILAAQDSAVLYIYRGLFYSSSAMIMTFR